MIAVFHDTHLKPPQLPDADLTLDRALGDQHRGQGADTETRPTADDNKELST